MTDRRSERFAAMPRRVVRDPRVKGSHLLLSLILVDEADPQKRTVVTRPREIEADARWPWTAEKARRDLHDLREWGLVQFDVSERQQRPWRIRLTGLWLQKQPANEVVEPANENPVDGWQAPANEPANEPANDGGAKRDSEAVTLPTSTARSPSTSKPSTSRTAALGAGTHGSDSSDGFERWLRELKAEAGDIAFGDAEAEA